MKCEERSNEQNKTSDPNSVVANLYQWQNAGLKANIKLQV